MCRIPSPRCKPLVYGCQRIRAYACACAKAASFDPTCCTGRRVAADGRRAEAADEWMNLKTVVSGAFTKPRARLWGTRFFLREDLVAASSPRRRRRHFHPPRRRRTFALCALRDCVKWPFCYPQLRRSASACVFRVACLALPLRFSPLSRFSSFSLVSAEFAVSSSFALSSFYSLANPEFFRLFVTIFSISRLL